MFGKKIKFDWSFMGQQSFRQMQLPFNYIFPCAYDLAYTAWPCAWLCLMSSEIIWCLQDAIKPVNERSISVCKVRSDSYDGNTFSTMISTLKVNTQQRHKMSSPNVQPVVYVSSSTTGLLTIIWHIAMLEPLITLVNTNVLFRKTATYRRSMDWHGLAQRNLFECKHV